MSWSTSEKTLVARGALFGGKVLLKHSAKRKLSRTQTKLRSSIKYTHPFHGYVQVLQSADLPVRLQRARTRTAVKTRALKSRIARATSHHTRRIECWVSGSAGQRIDSTAAGRTFIPEQIPETVSCLLANLLCDLARYTQCPEMLRHQQTYAPALEELLTTTPSLRHVPQWERHYVKRGALLQCVLEPLDRINQGLDMCKAMFRMLQVAPKTVDPSLIDLFDNLCAQRHAYVQRMLVVELQQRVRQQPSSPQLSQVHRQRFHAGLRVMLA